MSALESGSQELCENEFDRLYRRYRRDMGRVVRRILKGSSPEEVEDHIHEVFLKAIGRKDTFRGESSLATWLYRITVNHCLDLLRKRRRGRQVELVFDSAVAEYSVGQDVRCEIRDREAVDQLLLGQSPLTVAFVRMAYCESLTPSEIADIHGISRAAVSRRLQKFRESAKLDWPWVGIW